ncbi:unnamed protein product [Pylaiella littoralis]
MKSSHRSHRRRVTCLALIWLSLAQCRTAFASLDSRKGARPLLLSFLESPLFNATEVTGPQAEPLSSSSSGSAVIPSAPSMATQIYSPKRGHISCISTSTPIMASGPVPSHSAGTATLDRTRSVITGRRVLTGLTGGASFRRNRKQQQQQQWDRSSTATTRAPRTDQSTNISAWPEIRRILKKCLMRAGSGGLPGAAAGVLQVVTLMWLRTIVNYQCRYGTSIGAAASELYQQGGVLRFYRGVVFALVSNPLSRFGMAAANEGAMALTDALPRQVSVTLTTWIASLFAGLWRVMLTPLDTCKTVLQVEGPKGFASLMKKVWGGDLVCLYQGAMAAAAATAVGYFPWFLTFNYLNGRVRKPSAMAWMLLRNAAIGLASSVTSDVCSNSIRVLKTTKQAAAAYDAKVTYRGAAALVIEKDGFLGLFGRGLSTRILANGLQSMLFTVVWRYLHDKYVVPTQKAADLREEKNLGIGGATGNSSRRRARGQQGALSAAARRIGRDEGGGGLRR